MHADILEDPDAELEKGLKAEDHETTAYVLHALVKHLDAGGVVPERLRGQGTALAELAWGVTAAVGFLDRIGFGSMADLLRRRLAAVTGEG